MLRKIKRIQPYDINWDSVSQCKIYCGAIVTSEWSNSEVCLFKNADFKDKFGREFDNSCDAIAVMNGDGNAQGGAFYQVRYYPSSKNIWVSTNITNQGAIRLNYIAVLGWQYSVSRDVKWIKLNNVISYRKCGNMVTVIGASSGDFGFGNKDEYGIAGTLPSKYRPSIEVPFVFHAMGGTSYNKSAKIETNGQIKLYDRGTYVDYWGFCVTYPIQNAVKQHSVSRNKILWSGAAYMQASQTIDLLETVDSQPNGIVLAWSGFDFVNQEVKNYDWNYFFVPKYHVDKSNDNGAGVSIFLVNSNASYLCAKYVYVYNNKIAGNENNNKENVTAPNSGVRVNNKRYVLRYVIGV